jgi:hypothetical protein
VLSCHAYGFVAIAAVVNLAGLVAGDPSQMLQREEMA